MKIGIITWGSNGDIEPFVPLALKLAQKNHIVDIFIFTINNKDYSYLNNTTGISVTQKMFEFEKVHSENENVEWWNVKEGKSCDLFEKRFNYIKDDLIKQSIRLCESCDAVIGTQFTYFLVSMAEKYNIPYISVCYEPSLIRSKYVPPLGMENYGEESNINIWNGYDKYIHDFYAKDINNFRREHGIKEVQSVLNEITHSKFLNIITYSRHFLKHQPDWEGRHFLCGYLNNYENTSAWDLPSDLEDFIAKSDQKPILISLGSMIEYENEIDKLHSILIEAAKTVNRNIIIHSKWNSKNHSEGNIYKLSGFISYPPLLSKCALVLHHGGTGTSHFVTALGCPSIIMEYGFDQGYNAKILYNSGVLSGYLKRKDLTASGLSAIINEALKKDNKVTAEALGKALRQEKALETAVELIENKLNEILQLQK